MVLLEGLAARRGDTMDKKEIILALILVCLLGIAGKMDYNDAQAESELTHREEVTR
jgi:hypothetical protein